MFRTTDKVLKSAGILQSRLRYEETLENGFAFGLWWKYYPRPSKGEEQLATFLSRINLTKDKLRAFDSDRVRLDTISEKLERERVGLQHWFKLGLWLFANTWLLGSEQYADTTESARALVRDDLEVRAIGSNLMGCLQDIGWSPEECENFYIEKIVPFLYDPGHRNWVDNPAMAVLSDLKFKAKALDADLNKDSDTKRITGATRALISEIPVVGKALEILIFGAKK